MDWSQTAAAGASALGGLMSNVATGLFNANQAAINRNFQREMYERQYKDSIEFWKMQNAYNDPSAQLDRIKRSGLNPLLLYSSGGVQNVATSQPNQPQKPSGAQTSAAFSNPLDLAQYALLDAEREKKKAETEKTKSETDWTNLQLQYDKDTYAIRYAIQHKQWDMMEVGLQEMRNNIVNSGMITSQQVQTMIQGREMEIKRFNLDSDVRGEQLRQGWKGLELQKEQNNIAWRGLAIQMGHLLNETNMTNTQIGMLQWNLLKDKAMFGLDFESKKLDLKLKMWDSHLKKATLTEKQINVWNGVLKNTYLRQFGHEQVDTPIYMKFGERLKFDKLKPAFQDLFIIPNINPYK